MTLTCPRCRDQAPGPGPGSRRRSWSAEIVATCPRNQTLTSCTGSCGLQSSRSSWNREIKSMDLATTHKNIVIFFISVQTWMLKSWPQSYCRDTLCLSQSQISRWWPPWEKMLFFITSSQCISQLSHLKHVLPGVCLMKSKQCSALCHSTPVGRIVNYLVLSLIIQILSFTC